MSARPLIIAHRGASANAPENTLAAFRAATKSGADGIELDVRLARDGVPVVIHDHDLKRTGSRNERVAEITSAELANVDVGSWFNAAHPKRAKPSFADARVPTLAQVLELLREFPGLIYIELKFNAADHRALTTSVCDLIQTSPRLPQMIVKTFRLAAIPEIRHQLPQVQTAALVEPTIMTVLRRRKYIVDLAREFGAHQLSLHRSLVTPKLMSLAARANMPVTVWTTDNPNWIRRSRKLGITALITNDPAKMLRAETSRCIGMNERAPARLMNIVRTTSENEDFHGLVTALDRELAVRDGDEYAFYAQFNKLDTIRHAVVVYLDGKAVGCGAIRRFDEEAVEVKRMFVPVEHRGRGIATLVLNELESWAAELSFKRCILETGLKQPEAIALYTKSGYTRIPNYGHYEGVDNSICFEKRIA